MAKKQKTGRLRVLGIETSCDETAAAVVAREAAGNGAILSNLVHSQLEDHAAFGGVVPEIAARAHVEILDQLIAAALDEAGLGFGDLDGVAATAGPGLIGGLMVGLMTAKAIAAVRDLPLIAVNHLEAHALTPGLTQGLRPPYLLLLVSGGHTQLVIVREIGRYTRLGTTLDDALGETYDKTAKLLGLGYPGGPEVERWAARGDGQRFELPAPMLGREQPDFSFSGLKTALRRRAQALAPLSEQDIADLCASFQATVARVVADRTGRAMALYREQLGPEAPRQLVVSGGVAANAALRQALAALCEGERFDLMVPPPSLCTDNAAMIAWAGAEHLAQGHRDGFDAAARARWPLDESAPPAIGAGVKA
jgi:N6-L-threonylcarbamoyladenine synthase